jgi:hypothetical protein
VSQLRVKETCILYNLLKDIFALLERVDGFQVFVKSFLAVAGDGASAQHYLHMHDSR